MSVLDFFWVFLIVIALQPLFKQKFLELSRKRLLARMERQRSSRMILLVHHQEAMVLLNGGAPIWMRP